MSDVYTFGLGCERSGFISEWEVSGKKGKESANNTLAFPQSAACRRLRGLATLWVNRVGAYLGSFQGCWEESLLFLPEPLSLGSRFQ